MSDITDFFRQVRQQSPVAVHLDSWTLDEERGVFICQVELGPVTVSSLDKQSVATDVEEYEDIPPAAPMEQRTYPSLRTTTEVSLFDLQNDRYTEMVARRLSSEWDAYVREIDVQRGQL